MPSNNALHLPPILDHSERPLMAESGLPESSFSEQLNVRSQENRKIGFRLLNLPGERPLDTQRQLLS